MSRDVTSRIILSLLHPSRQGQSSCQEAFQFLLYVIALMNVDDSNISEHLDSKSLKIIVPRYQLFRDVISMQLLQLIGEKF